MYPHISGCTKTLVTGCALISFNASMGSFILGQALVLAVYAVYFHGVFYAMDASIDVDVHNKSCEYSGTETSVKPSTRQGNLNGEETYQTCVESPARWGYAKTMESEKAKHEQMIVKYEQMKTRYEQMKIKYEQMNAIYAENCELLHEEIHAKHEQTCEWNTSLMNGQFNGAFVAKNKAEFTEQKPLHKSPTDNPPSACALQTDETDECRNSREV
ncbi:hypothetical protein ACROYT_G024639 [Oculina patagonica]